MSKNDLDQAKEISLNSGYVSTSVLQRNLSLGYNKAKQITNSLIEENFCEQTYTANLGHKIIKEVIQ